MSTLPPMSAPLGAWFVYGIDMQDYPKGLFATEVEALRYALDNYGHVKFWLFGMSWDEAQKVKP